MYYTIRLEDESPVRKNKMGHALHLRTQSRFLFPPRYLCRSKKTRRTIFSGADLVYEETWKQNGEDFAAGAGEDVPWVWVHSAAEPTRHAPSLRIAPVRDTGCAQDAPETAINWQEGKGGDTNANEAIILGDEQLGDVYHQTGRWARNE